MRRLLVHQESWPIAGSFTIARGSKTSADVVVVTVEEAGATGRGECVPYARYGETVEAVLHELEHARERIESGLDRTDIPATLGLKAASNALDCALWDLKAKITGLPAWRLAGLTEPHSCTTAYTISLSEPEVMARQAKAATDRPLLKLKLGRPGDEERLVAVREAVPEKRLIVDANEGWTADTIENMLTACKKAKVELVEQPLPAQSDDLLGKIARPVPVCADESVHGIDSLSRLKGKYDAVNIKLDKTGGLTPALALADAAEIEGFQIMVGCMLATSLAMAPAFLLTQRAQFVDLDGPLLLSRDRPNGIVYEGATMFPPTPDLWG
jgi:L-alanine-DL-glutamate epimerase-like enolase superfamily enzyme